MARLIIVEDNSDLASLLVSAARARGHDPLAVGTGHAALQALGGQAFDGAVVDLLLPDTRGTEILNALRARHVPAIAMSGVYKGERFARETVEQHGAAKFFQKPFDTRVLLMALEQAIEAAGGQPLDAELIEDEDGEPALLVEVEELEELTPLEESEGDEPLTPFADGPTPPPANAGLLEVPEFVAAAPMLSASVGPGATPDQKLPPPELGEEPTTPTRMLGKVELDALLRNITAEPGSGLLSVVPNELETDADADSPTKVAYPFLGQPAPVEPTRTAEPSTETGPSLMVATLADVEAAFTTAEIADPPEEPPPPEPPPARSASQDAVLPFAERGGVWHQPGPTQREEALSGWNEAGDITRGLVPRLLNAFYRARYSGELKLKQDSVVKVIQVEGGQPVYAASNLASERLGRFCVQRGALAEADLRRVAELGETQKLRTGEAMLRLGLLTPARHVQLVEEQVREIVWSTFGWSRGRYAVTSGRASRPGLVKLQIHPAGLILEGVLHASTLVALRQDLPAERRLFPSKNPPYAPHEIALGRPQASLLAAADGSKTVEDLLTISDLTERETLAALVGFQILGLLEERRDEGRRQRISFGL